MNEITKKLSQLSQRARGSKEVKYILIFIAFVVAAVIWRPFIEPTGALAYSIICYYLCLPIAGGICNYKVARHNTTARKYIYPLLFAFVNYLLPYVAFGATGYEEFLSEFILCFLGLLLGIIVRKINKE